MTFFRIKAVCMAAFCAVGLAACKTGDMSKSIIGAASLVTALDVSTQRQREIGHAGAVQVRKNALVSDDSELTAHLNRVFAKLVAAAGAPGEYTYQVHVLEDPQLNAFTPGGGHVFITTGLIRALGTEGEVAAVLAHELGHVTESHVVRGMRDRTGIQVAADLGASATGINTKLMRELYGYVLKAAVNGHGRRFEEDADALAIDTLVAAGYDPTSAILVFEALKRMYGDRSELANFFHGSHPTNQKRIEAIRAMLAEKYADLNRAGLVRDTAAFAAIKKRYPNGFDN